MKLFGKHKPPANPQEEREELLREFIWGNEEYKIKFDKNDLKQRQVFLRSLISRGWISLGIAGLGYTNYRLISSSQPSNKWLKYSVLSGFLLASVGFWTYSYFSILIDVQDYLKEKYLTNPKNSDATKYRGSNDSKNTSH